jgi:VIT1/CCC1 family predicted Fe2+/Mn2+ transporter
MPATPHLEKHFTASEVVRDIVIGMADGLTVPFALAAGLSGAVDSTHIIIVAGLAEIAAGSIAMGLGGYLAAKNDAEHYENERQREIREVEEVPEEEKREVAIIFQDYGMSVEQAIPIVESLSRNPKKWVDFMMRYELGLERPDPKRAPRSAATIAVSYIIGGLVPLSPYIFINNQRSALAVSVVVTLTALLVFGYIKGLFSGTRPLAGALRTALIGGAAAAAAFAIARLISGAP